jgi:hypothetical protein
MQKIFEGEIFDVLPITNGIIFSYCKDTVDDNILISYKMITFDNGRIADVAKNIYLITKFGNNYRAVAAQCDNYITVKSILLPNGKVFLMQTDGTAKPEEDGRQKPIPEKESRKAAETPSQSPPSARWPESAACALTGCSLFPNRRMRDR